jgi:hypothetical protein
MKTDLQTLEELLGIEGNRITIEIVYDPGKRKLRAQARTSDRPWVRFPNKLRVLGAVYECEGKRGVADSFITVGDILAMNDIAREAKRRSR